jgi:sarcosine oxidase subunit beta
MLRGLRVVRHWSGYFDVSPDHTPIIEFSKNAEGLVTICGFSGHGFMIAPRTAIMVARRLCKEVDTIDINKFSVGRYETGDLLIEPSAL